MKKIYLSAVCAVLFSLAACSEKEPANYGGIPKETLDKVAKDAEAATQQAKEKVDEALKKLE